MKNRFNNTGRLLLKTARFCITPLLDFLYPSFCLVCERQMDKNALLCPQCIRQLNKSFIVKHNHVGHRHSIDNPSFDAAHAALSYTPSVQLLIHCFKYRGYSRLSGLFSGFMAEHAIKRNIKLDALQPVPLHSGRQRERGFNQSEYLCRHLSKQLNVPVLDCLERRRYTRQQAKHDREKRLLNVKNAFRLKNPVPKGYIALVDDVMTTGATVHECGRILKEAGAERILVFTIC